MYTRGNVVAKGQEVSWIPLSKDTVCIGRSPKCDLWVADPKASRRHFEIRKTPEGYVMADLISKNGTRLNGNNVNYSMIKDGDTISMGDSKLTFRLGFLKGPKLGGRDLKSGSGTPDTRPCDMNTTMLIRLTL